MKEPFLQFEPAGFATAAHKGLQRFSLILHCDTPKSLWALLVADVLVTCWFILSPLCRDGKVKVEDSKEDLLCSCKGAI